MQASSLYKAQAEAQESVNWHFFPAYNTETYFSIWNTPHNVCGAISSSARFIADTVTAIAHAILVTLDNIVYYATSVFGYSYHLMDTFYPENPIDNKRHPCLLSMKIEKAIGSILFCLSGLTSHVFGNVTDDNQQEVAIQKFTTGLVRKLENANKELVNKSGLFSYEATVVASPQLNAFALPGGKMVFFEHIITQIQKSLQEQDKIKETTIRLGDGSAVTIDLEGVSFESVIAALIGHEMTHAASRHGIFSITLQCILDIFIAILPSGLGDLVQDLYFLMHSRENEYEADITGAFLAAQAGYDPRGALYLQEFFKTATHHLVLALSEISELLSTHPCTNSRLTSLFAGIASFSPQSLKDHIIQWTSPGFSSISELTSHITTEFDRDHLSPAIQRAINLRNAFPESTSLSNRKQELGVKDQFTVKQALYAGISALI